MRRGNGWIKMYGLQLALSKTEIVVITLKGIKTIILMRVEEREIETKPSETYIWVMVDGKMNFGNHI